MEKFLKLAKDDYAKGIATFNSCNKAGSIPFFTRHLETYPDDYNARRMRARAYGIVGENANCLADLRTLRESSSGPHRLTAELEIAKEEGNGDEFLALLQKLVNTYPNHAAGWDFLAFCFLRRSTRNDEEALKVLHKAVEVAEKYDQTDLPEYPWDYNFLGDVYYRKKDWDQAEKSYKAAIEVASTLTVAHIGLGRVHIQKNNPREARRCYDTARELNPKLAHWETFEDFRKEELCGTDTGYIDDNTEDTNKETVRESSVKSFSTAQQKEIAEAQKQADELIELLTAWVPLRKATVSHIRETASASPAEKQHQLKRAQKALEEDTKISEEIENKATTLCKLVNRLSLPLELDKDRITGILIMAKCITALNNDLPHEDVNHTTLLLIHLSQEDDHGTFKAIGKEASKIITGVSLQSALKAVGSALQDVATGAARHEPAWDVCQWIRTIADLGGGKSYPADALKEVADELAEHLKEIDNWLDDVRKRAKEYEEMINEHFRQLLEKISNNGYATEDEKQEVWQHVHRYADPDWKDEFLNRLNYDNYTFHLARVFSILDYAVREYQDKEEDEEKKRTLNITVISHGGIDVEPNNRISCFSYYLTQSLRKVTLYEPWGCAIVATTVYGITTNTIATENVWYTTEDIRPSKPNWWNVLPRSGELTPNIILTPVKIGEPAHQRLMNLFYVLKGESDGLVIPYFNGPGEVLLPFPEIPFWVFCITCLL